MRELRGNVDTRLRRLAEGDFDAIVLAQAGLDRLGRGDEGTPARCRHVRARRRVRAASRVETRGGDEDAADGTRRSLTRPRHRLTCLTEERGVVRRLDATCNTPIGAHATWRREGLLP